MRKMLAIALVSTFAFVAFAADKKPETKKASDCGQECCKKSQADPPPASPARAPQPRGSCH